MIKKRKTCRGFTLKQRQGFLFFIIFSVFYDFNVLFIGTKNAMGGV